MSSTSDTPNIDEKKTESTTDNKNNTFDKLSSFIISILTSLFILFIAIIIGTIVLYACKIGQSNILPTNMDCFPYTSSPTPEIQQIPINIFISYIFSSNSEKIEFPFEKNNKKNTFIDTLRYFKERSNASFLTAYFISILEGALSFNYSALNTFFNYLNNIPEILIFFIGPALTFLYTLLLFCITTFYVMFLWFSQMYWFFKSNSNTSVDGKPKWNDVTFFEPMNYCIGVFLVILFILLFWLSIWVFPIISSVSINWCIFSLLGYTGIMNGKSVSFFNILQDVFKYYKGSISSIISFIVVLSSFSHLGTISGVFSLLTVALIYFGIFPIDLFQSKIPEAVSKLVSYEQAKKTCKIPPLPHHGLLYRLIYGQSGGKQFMNEIKNIGKKLKQND